MADGADEIARAARALEEAASLLVDRSGQLRDSEQRFRSLLHDAVGMWPSWTWTLGSPT